jgi:hypothetical protein
MNKFIGPYEACHDMFHGEETYRRPRLNDTGFHSIWKESNGWRVVGVFDTNYTSKEAAMKVLDKILIEDGWIILDREKFDALKILL